MASLCGQRFLMLAIVFGQYLRGTVCISPSYNNLTKLYTEVLTGYDTRIKPRENQREFVNVTIDFSIISIVEFDIVDQILKTGGVFTFNWIDEHIKWEPDKFEGIDEIDIPVSQVWSPTIVVGMGFESFTKLDNKEDVVTYHQTGKASWTSKGIYSVFCEVDAKYYPYDTQSCSVSISVTQNLLRHVNLQASDNKTSRNDFKMSSRWVLVDVALTSQSESTSLVLKIKLQRQPEVVMSAVFAPAFILQQINSFACLVPVESKEKGSIAITFFLAYGVFISTVSNELPSSSKRISLMAEYIAFMFSFSAICVVFSLIETMYYFKISLCIEDSQKLQTLKRTLAKIDIMFFSLLTGTSLLFALISFVLLGNGSDDFYQEQ